MTTAPSKIHSHRSEEADPPLATGDDEGDSADGEGAGATADAVTVGWTVEREGEGLGDLVPGENVGSETLMLLLAAALDTAFLCIAISASTGAESRPQPSGTAKSSYPSSSAKAAVRTMTSRLVSIGVSATPRRCPVTTLLPRAGPELGAAR
jgi:hypothetical protein